MEENVGSARPKAKIEPPQPPPGGPNAIGGVGGDGAATAGDNPIPHDLDPELSPTSDDAGVPDDVQSELEEGEDTDTQATKGEDGPEPKDEPPS